MNIKILTTISPEHEDFIYNRFDILYGDNKYILVEDETLTFSAPFHIEGNMVFLGVYLRNIPDNVLKRMIEHLFTVYKKVRYINIKCCICNYENRFEAVTHWRVSLPNSFEELFSRTNRKSRETMRRKSRKLEELGHIEFLTLNKNEITKDIVEQYFCFKENTYDTNYHMAWNEYIENYHVSNAYLCTLNKSIIAIAFTCEQCPCAFLENISYDRAYSKYSVGFQVYTYLLSQLIINGKKQLYLGVGEHDYKKRFAGISEDTYSGNIYRNQFWHMTYGLRNRMKMLLGK